MKCRPILRRANSAVRLTQASPKGDREMRVEKKVKGWGQTMRALNARMRGGDGLGKEGRWEWGLLPGAN